MTFTPAQNAAAGYSGVLAADTGPDGTIDLGQDVVKGAPPSCLPTTEYIITSAGQ